MTMANGQPNGRYRIATILLPVIISAIVAGIVAVTTYRLQLEQARTDLARSEVQAQSDLARKADVEALKAVVDDLTGTEARAAAETQAVGDRLTRIETAESRNGERISVIEGILGSRRTR